MNRLRIIATLVCVTGCVAAQPEQSAPQLAVVRILVEPFSLGFHRGSDFPIGSNWNGFVAVKFTPKVKMKTLPDGNTGEIDVSELTLKRGDETITLVKDERVPFVELIADLVDQSGGTTFMVKKHSEVSVGSRRLRVRDVSAKNVTCTLEDVTSGEQFIITKQPKTSGGGTRTNAPSK